MAKVQKLTAEYEKSAPIICLEVMTRIIGKIIADPLDDFQCRMREVGICRESEWVFVMKSG